MGQPELDALMQDPEVKPLVGVNYLRRHQRVERQREIDQVERMLQDPVAQKALQRPGELRRQTAERKKTLEAQTPPPLTPGQRAKLERFDREALPFILEGLPTLEEERRAAPGDGTADRVRAWDKVKKPYVLAWKRAQLLLHPDSEDRNLCNLDRHRRARPTQNLYLDSPLPKFVTPGLGIPEQDWNRIFERDWRRTETQEQFTGRMAEQGITVKFTRARPTRAPRDGGKVYECPGNHAGCEGRIFSGGSAKRNYDRHMAAKREVPA